MQEEFTPTLVGNYIVRRKLGRSPFTDVYLAEDSDTHQPVAIKMQNTPEKPSTSVVDFLLSRVRTISRLHHPHITQIFSCGVQDHTIFFAMQYTPFESILQNYPGGSQLPIQAIIQYVQHIADALQYAHDQQILHAYLKPENILLATPDYVLVSDFGPATNFYLSHITNTSLPPSTYYYLAPEQITGEPLAASDQYALAAMVYEWLCGAPPFIGSAEDVLTKHLKSEPTPLYERVSGIALSVDEVLQIAMAKNPNRRFASIEAFAMALEQTLLA